jgi:D-alanyl-D-alanine carboxypeptidase
MTNTQLQKHLRALIARSFKPEQPGVAAIVTRDGEPLLRTARGMANLELGVPLAPESVFRIASMTKQFTGVAILMLQARGKLAVTDRITRFLPKYPTRGHTITIEHLLRHTSGIQSYTDMPSFWKQSQQYKTVAEHIDFFKNEPMLSKPGERWVYNNSGYFLLGAIIEKVSGHSYADFIKRFIFDKLGMSRSCFDEPTQIVPGRVTGYQHGASGLQIADYLSTAQVFAAGALLSCVDDLARWDAALYTDQLVKQRVLQAAWSRGALNDGSAVNYGYGWSLNGYAGQTCIEHSGGINGFVSFGIRIPEKRVYAAVLINTSSPPIDAQLLAFKLAALAIGAPHADPRAVRVHPTTLARYAGRFVFTNDPKNGIDVQTGGGAQRGTLLLRFAPQADPRVLHPSRQRDPTQHEFFVRDSLLRVIFDVGARSPALRIVDRDTVIFNAKRKK